MDGFKHLSLPFFPGGALYIVQSVIKYSAGLERQVRWPEL